MDGKTKETLVSSEFVSLREDAFTIAESLLEKIEEVTEGLFQVRLKIEKNLFPDVAPVNGDYVVRLHNYQGQMNELARTDNLYAAIGYAQGWNGRHEESFAVVHFEGESEVAQ